MPRRSSIVSRLRTLRPPIVMSPSEMSISRLTIFIAVVLPPPEGPTSTQISPAGTTSERSSTAGAARPGYRLVTWSKTISAAAPFTPEAYVLTLSSRDRMPMLPRDGDDETTRRREAPRPARDRPPGRGRSGAADRARGDRAGGLGGARVRDCRRQSLQARPRRLRGRGRPRRRRRDRGPARHGDEPRLVGAVPQRALRAKRRLRRPPWRGRLGGARRARLHPRARRVQRPGFLAPRGRALRP